LLFFYPNSWNALLELWDFGTFACVGGVLPGLWGDRLLLCAWRFDGNWLDDVFSRPKFVDLLLCA
jgi:hypothetical protein